MPSIFIHGEYRQEIISNMLKRQKKVIAAINKEITDTGFSNIDPRGFIILDDCLYDKSWVNSKHIRSLFMNGRLRMYYEAVGQAKRRSRFPSGSSVTSSRNPSG